MKSYSLLFFFMLMVSVTYTQNTLPLSFSESFKDNTNRWDDWQETNEYVHNNTLYVNVEKDFKIILEVDATPIDRKDASWGLSWGRSNLYNYYYFEINKQKKFRISRFENGLRQVLKPWKRHKSIRTTVDELQINRKGEKLVFLINSVEVHAMDFQKFYGTELSIRSSDATIQWKKLEIYQNMGPINVATSVKESKAKKENLGPAINSAYIDKFPIISPDGKVLYYLREDYPGDYGGQDIWYATQLPNGEWSKGQNIGSELNNKASNFVNSVLPDNNTICLSNTYERASREAILAFSKRTVTGWSKPEIKAIHNLKKQGRWVSFYLAADGRTLVFTMLRPDSYGGRDLYVSFLGEDGHFSSPKNLGPILNTTANEHCPFLAADGKTLYFDTDGHPGYGGRDIFMAKRLDESWTNWEVPKNLGPTINTKGADEGLVIPASGAFAYFVSDKDSYGGYDIYSLKMPKALRPEPTALITGYVINCFDQKGIPTRVQVYKEGTLVEDAYARTNPINGEFKLALAGGFKYRIVAAYNAELEESNQDTILIDLTNLKEYEEQELKPICFEPKRKLGEPVKVPIRAQHTPSFKSVYFDHDKYLLTTEAKERLNKMADTLKIYPDIALEVLGHTDSNGSDSYNWTLAMHRSSTVVNYLKIRGIDPSRFAFKGFGETQPTATNTTDTGRAVNRRVEFRVIRRATDISKG